MNEHVYILTQFYSLFCFHFLPQFLSHVCPAYSRYCMNYAGALQYLQALKKQEDFLEFTKV